MEHIFIIIVIMILAGMVGGVINYLLNPEAKGMVFKDKLFWKSLFLGIGASLLVPLFLNMISSSIISESVTNQYQLLVFLGFCLIAAISSKSFIETITEKLLNDMKQRVEQVEQEVKPIIDKETETDSETDEPEPEEAEAIVSSIGDNEIKVLNSVASSGYTYRSISGISTEVGMSRPATSKYLNSLINNGLVSQGGNSKAKFYATEQGRKIASISQKKK